MDPNHFATVTRSLTALPARRDVLRGLVAAGLGLGISRLAGGTEAKKRGKNRKKPKRKARPNAFGCLSVGVSGKNAGQCCSGICQRKKCRAHDTGICGQDVSGVCTTPTDEVPLRRCGNSAGCSCFRTTAGSNYCASVPSINNGLCADCKKDADCVALGFPPQAACAPVSQGQCSALCPTGMACLVPCGTVLP